MLIGELDADTLLSVNYIVVTILMLVFITIAITLLFNLTTAIAIPEVAYLRENAHKTLFKAKNRNYYYQQFSRQLFGLDLKKYLDNFKE
ncbi:hypothetical protein WR25_26986 [Diploscapter pachys]|uniref:Uncharacterized protein n=1 Tax=Diploscapter pachys TaxID=2018661 RepID=A0A2A2KBS8_9BILA|nr:hypothetical protein WR25_26986 [Diploscapter pachys]